MNFQIIFVDGSHTTVQADEITPDYGNGTLRGFIISQGKNRVGYIPAERLMMYVIVQHAGDYIRNR